MLATIESNQSGRGDRGGGQVKVVVLLIDESQQIKPNIIRTVDNLHLRITRDLISIDPENIKKEKFGGEQLITLRKQPTKLLLPCTAAVTVAAVELSSRTAVETTEL